MQNIYRNRGKHFLYFPAIRVKSVATNYEILSNIKKVEEIVKGVMIEKFGSVQEAVKIPYLLTNRVRDKAVSRIIKEFSYLVDNKKTKEFMLAVDKVYGIARDNILKEYKR